MRKSPRTHLNDVQLSELESTNSPSNLGVENLEWGILKPCKITEYTHGWWGEPTKEVIFRGNWLTCKIKMLQ